MAREKEFLGKGMKFPPQVNPATGRFETVSEEKSVKESVYLILMTQKRERIVRPEFGSELMSYTFMDTSLTALSLMARQIKKDILSQEPRVSDVDVKIDSETKQGCLIVNIEYRISDTNVRDNLVFPFYLDATWDEPETEAEEVLEEQQGIG